jgi:hypothetical protein
VANPEQLSDRSVALALQEITEELADTNPELFPQDTHEAGLLLSALLAQADLPTAGTDPGDLIYDRHEAARRVLTHLATDPDTAARTRAVIADAPTDEQLSVEAAALAAVVLATTVSWLQTKVDIRIHRHDGRTDFDFSLRKTAASPGTLRRVAEIVYRLLSGPPAP